MEQTIGLYLVFIVFSFSLCSVVFLAMGNALRFLCGKCGKPTVEEEQAGTKSLGPHGVTADTVGVSALAHGKRGKPTVEEEQAGTESLGPHGVTADTVGVSALAHDLFHFEITSQVPEGLNQRVGPSREAQAKWYGMLLNAWKESKPPPKTPEEASRFIIKTLHKHQQADVEGLLAFYGLPLPDTLIELETSDAQLWAEGVKFEFQTLPVDVKLVGDGDSFTVYVDTADPMVSASVPTEIHEAAIERSNARAVKNYVKADELQKKMVDAGYRIINGPNNEEILAQKYRIRLRGIDAPESMMDFGKEAKEELAKLLQGKRLTVHAYGEDRYGRCVADVYCNGIFVQEYMLKKGLAWHYIAYDRRPKLASWERDARAASIGLWALPNPQKPWDWRKDQRNNASMETDLLTWLSKIPAL